MVTFRPNYQDIWHHICRISFSDSRAQEEEPKKHGDFTNPAMVELVLGMVKHGCPEPVDIRKDPKDTRSDDEFREDLQRRLENVPRFTSNSVAGIADNAPYMDKGALADNQFGDTHFLLEQSYEDIGGYFFPININAATIDDLALLLRGDRYLARQIFEQTCTKRYLDIHEMERDIPHLVNTGASELIMKHGIFGEGRPISDDSWFPSLTLKSLFLGHRPKKVLPTCVPSGGWPSIRHHLRRWTSRLSIFPSSSFRFRSLDDQITISTVADRYRENVTSEIETAGMNTPPVEESSIRNMFSKKNPWDVIINMDGQRTGIKVYTWARLEQRYSLKDERPDRAEKLADDIKRQADESGVHSVIFVTYEDVFSKPSMAKAKEAIQKALGEKFHSVYGLPKTIPGKIKSVLQRDTKERTS